jgi:four helix bundle protein
MKHPTSNIQHPTSNEEAATRRFDLEERMLAYAGRIVELVDELPSTRAANHIAGQLLRSGTSPYLHHGEVQAAESVNDFIHKLKVCLKELRESWRALRLLQRCRAVKEKDAIESLIDETHQLIRIFYQSVRTTESRGEQSPRMREDPASDHWMLDVECWMLDVPPPSELERRPVVYPKPAKRRRP